MSPEKHSWIRKNRSLQHAEQVYLSNYCEIYADHYGGEGTDCSRKVTDRGWEETAGRGTCTA